MSVYDTIRYETAGEIATITLDRPDKLNAWTPQMAEEQADAIGRANADRSIGAIVMTGAGRAFCAGADMDAVFQTRIDGSDPGNDTAGGSGGMPASVDWVRLMRTSKPIVAAINGPAIGIGLTMVLPADVIVATADAKLAMAFIKVGLVPELASTHFLAHRVGFGRASELCLTGRIVRGDEAARIGLVDHVVDSVDDLAARTLDIATALAASPTPQALMVKQLLTENVAETDLDLVQRRESALLAECWATPEHAEAVAAFREKRPPVFR
ncbi:MAG TPA: enoyl-CoA hydratase/isomerase family protein [Ilumatobacteraceae bacterium]